MNDKNLIPSNSRELKLSLPPLPGTNTAHPAFKMIANDLYCQFFNDNLTRCSHVGKIDESKRPVIAAAIAHYWYEHSRAIAYPSVRFDEAETQIHKWRKIAAGSREYDGAEIVGYTPHG